MVTGDRGIGRLNSGAHLFLALDTTALLRARETGAAAAALTWTTRGMVTAVGGCRRLGVLH